MADQPMVVVAGILLKNGRVLMRRRPPGVEFAGAWEFPGGKVEGDETLDEALRRELFEEVGVLAERFLLVGRHVFNPPEVKRHVRVVHLQTSRWHGEPKALEKGSEVRWIDNMGAYLLGQHVTPGVVALSQSGYLKETLGWAVSFGSPVKK